MTRSTLFLCAAVALLAPRASAVHRFLLVTDAGSNCVLAINPFNGARVEISGPNRGAGPAIGTIEGVAYDDTDDEIFYLTCRNFGGDPALIRIAWGTGDRTLVSSDDRGDSETEEGDDADFDAPKQIALISNATWAIVNDRALDRVLAVRISDGDRFFFDRQFQFGSAFLSDPTALAVETTGDVLINYKADGSTAPRLQRVYDSDGFVENLVGFFTTGPTATDLGPVGLFVEPSDDVLACFLEFPAIIRFLMDGFGAVTGDELVSAGSNFSPGARGTGVNFLQPTDLVRSEEGEIFVLDASQGVVEVDPTTGNRTLRSATGVGTGPALVLGHTMCLGRPLPELTPANVADHLTDAETLSLVKQEQADIDDDGDIDITDIVQLVNLGL